MPKLENRQAARLREATRLCRVAIGDCDELLKRTEEMLRRSGQDNIRTFSDS